MSADDAIFIFCFQCISNFTFQSKCCNFNSLAFLWFFIVSISMPHNIHLASCVYVWTSKTHVFSITVTKTAALWRMSIESCKHIHQCMISFQWSLKRVLLVRSSNKMFLISASKCFIFKFKHSFPWLVLLDR